MKTNQKQNHKLNKLAAVILTAGLAQNALASDNNADSDGTYWGIGIGSVLGAVIAGPPGAAVGATLGGAVGWGQDKDDELELSQIKLEQKSDALDASEMALRRQQSELHKARQKVSELTRSNAIQGKRLSELKSKSQNETVSNPTEQAWLAEIADHFSQEVYYRMGESAVPDYAESRLGQLKELLEQHPKLKVNLKGFADHRGSPEFNQKLAQSRAEGIRDSLINQGVSAERVSIEALGESSNLAQPGDSSNYILDRRVAIELLVSEVDANSVAAVDHPDEGELKLAELDTVGASE